MMFQVGPSIINFCGMVCYARIVILSGVGMNVASPYRPVFPMIVEFQLRQLRFADPMIERGSQLDQLRLLFLSCQGRQMQFASMRSSPTSLEFGELRALSFMAIYRG
jgi:hypothetical protein